MDPTKQLGKIREQVDKENAARRKYQKKWGKLVSEEATNFYSQKFINKQLRQTKEYQPYKPTGHGDSFFLSKAMYNSLVATCRCGRQKSEAHILKCLQKVRNKYLEGNDDSDDGDDDDESGGHRDSEIIRPSGIPFNIGKFPDTSGGMIGWVPNRYTEWERATHYISPKTTMPGYRIVDHPYGSIFIG